MLETSDIAGNAISILHDEGYLRAFQTPLLDGSRWFFVGGRKGHSLDGEWRFCLDLHDNGLRQK